MNCLLSGAIARTGGAQKRAGGVAGAEYSGELEYLQIVVDKYPSLTN